MKTRDRSEMIFITEMRNKSQMHLLIYNYTNLFIKKIYKYIKNLVHL